MKWILTVAMLALPLSGYSQPQQISAAVVGQVFDATIRHLYDVNRFADKPTDPKPVLKLDHVRFPVGKRVPDSRGGSHHPAEVFGRLNGFAGASIVTPERAKQCEAFAPADCITNGLSVVLRLSDPVLQGDSAYVDIFMSRSNPSNPADSLRMPLTSYQRTRADAGVYTVFLAKSEKGWVVTRMITRSRT